MTAHGFTAKQIEEGIIEAIHTGEVRVVPALLGMLAVQDPDRAQLFLSVIQAGIALADALEGADAREEARLEDGS